jgi:hypothetical protein
LREDTTARSLFFAAVRPLVVSGKSLTVTKTLHCHHDGSKGRFSLEQFNHGSSITAHQTNTVNRWRRQ